MNDKVDNFKVTDSQTFIEFLDLLRQDFMKNPVNWKNKTIPDFLKALSSCTENIQGYNSTYLNISTDKADWKIFSDIFKRARVNDAYPNPWNFNNTDRNLKSPNGMYKVEFGDLSEIAMGGPIGGECFLILDKKRIGLNDWCGGPIVWDTSSSKIALPVWTDNRAQKIAIVDIEKMEIATYKKLFRVLDLRTFDKNIVEGFDSPIHMTETLYFDIEREIVEEVKKLK